MNRKAEINRRIYKLIANFEKYLLAFDNDPPFKKPGQLNSHVQTIRLRRQLGTVRAAVGSGEFLRSLRATLQAWGIGSRLSRLVDLDAFAEAFRQQVDKIGALEGASLDQPGLELEAVVQSLWTVVDGLDVVENQARLVAGTKALHHLLPELIVPVDREFTGTFFGWQRPEFQYQQAKVFRYAFETFRAVATNVNPAQYVGSGWRTSPTKIIDNALVAFCRVEKLPRPS